MQVTIHQPVAQPGSIPPTASEQWRLASNSQMNQGQKHALAKANRASGWQRLTDPGWLAR